MKAVRFSPAMEIQEPNEAQTERELLKVMRSITETTSKDYGHAVRSVHAKSHALLNGTLRVERDLRPELAQGLFAMPAEYPVFMRISTIPGDILSDEVSLPRGLGIKVFNVPGERLPGSEDDTTQDFLMVDGPAFSAPTAAKFLGNLKLVAKTTDKAEGAKIALSKVLRPVEKALEAIGGKSALLTTLGGHALTNPVGDTYYSQTPFRYGDYVAKFSVAPVSKNLTDMTEVAIDLDGDPDGLREAIVNTFNSEGGTWEFRVQLLTDVATMPIEDSSIAWPEEKSAYVKVATLSVDPQTAWSEARSRVGDDQTSFSIWRGLAAHRPLGSINRLRKNAYDASAEFRSEKNRCPVRESHASMALPA